MMKLNRDDIIFKFLKGREIVIADILSRAYLNEPNENQLEIFMVKVIPRMSTDQIRHEAYNSIG